MIQLTEAAARQVANLQSHLENPEQRLRVFVENGGCSGLQYGMSFDLPKPDDHRIEAHGVELLLDEVSLTYLEDSVIDFDDGLQGKGFQIQNPRAQSTCGCGKSFN